MKTTSTIILASLMLFITCKKHEEEKIRRIQIEFSILSSSGNWFRDGAIYKDSYLVWAQDDLGTRKLISYSLKEHLKEWEYDYSGIPGWGQKMNIYNNIMVSDKYDLGISVFDLSETKLITSYRYDNIPNFTSDTQSTFYEGKIYKSILDKYNGYATIISINTEDGEVKNEYYWSENSDSKVILTSPLVFFNENTQKVNFIMLMQLSNSNLDSNKYSTTYLLSVNEDHSKNWIDTIATQTKGSFISYLPIIVKNELVINYEDYFNLYDKRTGERKWGELLNSKNSSKLINSMDEVYLNLGFSRTRLIKYDIKKNIITWNQSHVSGPLSFSGFEVLDNEIIYVPNSFGVLIVRDNESGETIAVDKQNLGNISSPKLYKEQKILVAHNKNEILGFRIK